MVHVVVINLQKRKDRWESFTRHIEERRESLSFIEDIQRLEAVAATPPARGCMLSHRHALQMAKDRQWESVLVLEDDARFQSDARETWQALSRELSSIRVWNVVFGASVHVRPRDVRKASPHLLGLTFPNGILTGTHCIWYHSRCFDRVMDVIDAEAISAYPYHLDLLLSSKLQFIFLCAPYLALFTEHDTSDIRIGRDTSVDYQNITNAQALALSLLK